MERAAEQGTSYMVEHTADFLIACSSVGLCVVMVELRGAHSQRSQRRRARRGCCHRRPGQSGTNGRPSGHMTGCRSWNGLPSVDLGHSPHASASKPRILVTVSPAIHGALNQPSFASQGGIELCQCPANSVAFCLINQAVTSVLVLAAAGSRVDTVFCLELLAKVIHVNRLNITTDGILHFDTIARVLEGNPLDPVAILPYNKRRCRWDRPWRGTGTCPNGRILVVNVARREGPTG